MRPEAKRNRLIANIRHAGAQPESVADFVIQFDPERPRPHRHNFRMLRRIESPADKVRPAPRDSKRILARETVNRISVRRLIHRDPILDSLERKPRTRYPPRPRKQDRDFPAMSMPLPRLRTP